MKKLLLILNFLALPLISSEDKRSFDGFEAIKVGCAFTINLTVGKPQSVVISATKKDFAKVTTKVEKKILKVEFNGNSKKPITIDISIPKVTALDASGSVAINVDEGSAKKLSIKTSGSSDLNLSKFKVDELDINISGSAQANVWATKSLNVDASGSAYIKYKGSPKVTKDISGSAFIIK